MLQIYDLYQKPQLFIIGLILISVWMLIWKGFALWHSAKNKQKGWFIAILILNTLGLLPIIYLIWFLKKTLIIKFVLLPIYTALMPSYHQ